jgi:hypothetical protein
MTHDTIVMLRRLLAAATPGPWANGSPGAAVDDKHMGRVTAPLPSDDQAWPCRQVVAQTWNPDHIVSYVGIPREQTVANAELIAAAVNALPEVLEAWERDEARPTCEQQKAIDAAVDAEGDRIAEGLTGLLDYNVSDGNESADPLDHIRDCIRHELLVRDEKIAEGEGARGWQPIATAPKDGTWILVWANHAGVEKRADVLHWSDEWDGSTFGWCNDEYMVGGVTHWQPLPPPPTAASST